ncbi:MAG: ArsR family transcriptional regulator [Rhizobiales bacterium 65-9]|mgnify:CR=1 FL=1|nr:Lrp/AsnC family transcriptional regulator [Hyphomicrobiales bacterium]OJY38164.1 MAG: ArsR family transcriptional regulator [Rhizobiales bacterium 65-9]
MPTDLDKIDLKILAALQSDATLTTAEIAERAGVSPTPCWRRIQRLEETGYIRKRVALLDREKLNVGVTVFVAIRTSQHSVEWLEKFHAALRDIPEVVEFHRLSGNIDYLVKAVVPDIAAYDALYKKLITRIELSDVTSMFAMEELKNTTELPLSHV